MNVPKNVKERRDSRGGCRGLFSGEGGLKGQQVECPQKKNVTGGEKGKKGSSSVERIHTRREES